MLASWENRKELADQWKHLVRGSRCDRTSREIRFRHTGKKNPAGSQVWIRSQKNDNNLSAGRYKPWKEQETVVTESPAQLLKELADLETDTMKKVQELMEMARDYE